jgi:hypothetical protein
MLGRELGPASFIVMPLALVMTFRETCRVFPESAKIAFFQILSTLLDATEDGFLLEEFAAAVATSGKVNQSWQGDIEKEILEISKCCLGAKHCDKEKKLAAWITVVLLKQLILQTDMPLDWSTQELELLSPARNPCSHPP